MKIRSLQLKNIGVFEDETIHFPEKKGEGAEIHILTGQNGTGKTTILQALASGVLLTEFFNFYHDKEERLFILEHSKSSKKLLKKFVNQESIGVLSFSDGTKFNIQKPSLESSILQYKEVVGTLTNFANIFLRNIKNVNFSAFAYSGYRFIDNQDDIFIKEKSNYKPLKNALEFIKDNEEDEDDYTLNQWLANKMAERNSAYFKGLIEESEKINKSIQYIIRIIEDITGESINFDYAKSKVFAIKNGIELDFDLLPDGLRSIISWLGDLIMRMDALKWENDLDIREREFILFLDEIEVHLHPYWQRKILPVVQKTFKNAQIFITTHSPFIVNSVDGAYIYELDLDKKGNSKVTKVKESSTADSYQSVIRSVFDISGQYGKPVQDKLDAFYKARTKIINGEEVDKKEFADNIKFLLSLNDRSIEDKIHFELEQIGEEIEL